MMPTEEQVLEQWHRVVSAAQAVADSFVGARLWVNDSFQYIKSLLMDAPTRHYAWGALFLAIFWPVLVTLLMALSAASTWLFWLLTSIVFGFIQLVYVSYQFLMILFDILLLSMLKTYSYIWRQLNSMFGQVAGISSPKSRRRIWRSLVDSAGSYESYCELRIDPKEDVLPDRRSSTAVPARPTITRSRSFSGSPARRMSAPAPSLVRTKSFVLANDKDVDDETLQLREELGITGDMLLDAAARLRQARQNAENDNASDLHFLLSGVVKRNHLTVDDILVENARSVAELGRYGLSMRARRAILDYFEQVETSLDWLAESPLPSEESPDEDSNAIANEMHDRITLVRKMKQNVGRTALMLSGGGAQAMYHLGTVRALIESKLYDDIKVISGTSGGSITAAMCALKTSEELYRDVCVSNVSTDYLLNGEMKKNNIRWFPPVMEMGAYWLKHKLLVDSADFKKCCDFYYGDTTFEEAFQRTGKHVCITVSASRTTGSTAQRLLLNHISTPHVTLSSAVAASCALPGVMAPAKLLAKNSNGVQEPFEVDGVEWIDGSVQADLPFQRISTLFNVTNYVVCQTNFHVVPLINKAHHPGRRSLYWKLFQTLEWDIRGRALKLSRLGLFPRIFGQDISKIFQQKYHGNLTLVPRFTAMQTFGLKALANPTVKDMDGYLKWGARAAWPYLE